jgi:carbon starvation protein
VPTPRAIVFGHHFTSIAGTGPIVGPAIGVIWGWLPALLWVLLGSIFVGAVHDLGSLVVSLRNEGKSVGELAGRIVGPRVRWLFMWILVMALTLVLAVFGLVITAVFRQFPMAIFPCLVQIPLALMIGGWVHRKGRNITLASFATLVLMYLSVIYGDTGWLHAFNQTLASMPVCCC